MKLTAMIVGAAAAATMLVSANAASASAVISESYDYFNNDAAFLHVTNNGPFAFTNVTISGGYAGLVTDFGALASGATVDFYLGDNENDFPGSQGTALVSVVANGMTYSGSFTDVLGDPDFSVSPVPLGVLDTGSAGAVPEPASWAMMLAGFGILGMALRMPRRALSKVPAV